MAELQLLHVVTARPARPPSAPAAPGGAAHTLLGFPTRESPLPPGGPHLVLRVEVGVFLHQQLGGFDVTIKRSLDQSCGPILSPKEGRRGE